MCEKCDDLNQEIAITYPSALRRILRQVKILIADGTLAVDPPEGSAMGDQVFDDLDLDGPWPDVIEQGFACQHCGRRFALAVETYHGAGGHWRPAGI